VLRRIQTDLPKGLARLDRELEQLILGYFRACGIPFQRVSDDGHIRLQVTSSPKLPKGYETGGTVIIGRAADPEADDPLHPSHPLAQAAVEEARAASQHQFSVAWKVTSGAPTPLLESKGKRGRLVLSRIRYNGYERVDRLVSTILLEDDPSPLSVECGQWLLDQTPRDCPPVGIALDMEDAIEEMIFVDQAEVSAQEQQRFDRSLEQIERYVEDQLLVLRRRLAAETKSLRTAEERRDAALGSDQRDDAEKRIRTIQKHIDELESEIERLEKRDDPGYGQWRDRAHQRRYQPPEVSGILDVEFVLE